VITWWKPTFLQQQSAQILRYWKDVKEWGRNDVMLMDILDIIFNELKDK